MSLVKNLTPLTNLAPRAIVTWDKAERIRRNAEIWENPNSVVHRLPEHYKRRYWEDLLRDRTPVHYRPPNTRLMWDPVRFVRVPVEEYPIVPLYPPEADEGLWGGEGIVKGYIESKPYTRKKVLPRFWLPRLYFPTLKHAVLYSEILNKHFKITVTERLLTLVDKHFGLDFYLLGTSTLDLASRLGRDMKRQLLVSLAKEDYYPDDEERKSYIREKYSRFVIPLEEAEWIGLDLNEAAKKLQDIEDAIQPQPLKYRLESELVRRLREGTDVVASEEDFAPQTQESKFGEKLLGKYINPIGKKLRRELDLQKE